MKPSLIDDLHTQDDSIDYYENDNDNDSDFDDYEDKRRKSSKKVNLFIFFLIL